MLWLVGPSHVIDICETIYSRVLRRSGISLSIVGAGISGRSRADLAALTGHGRRFVTVDDAARVLDVGRAEAAKRLARWAEQGWLRRVRRDLYLAVPVDAVDPRAWGADPMVLAAVVWDPCYVTGWSAANHWGLTEQVLRTTVVKTTGRVRRSAQRLLDADFLLTQTGADALAWGMRPEWREQVRVRFADPARTVVDVLDQPRVARRGREAAPGLDEQLPATPGPWPRSTRPACATTRS